MKIAIAVAALLFLNTFANTTLANEVSRIELKDGSVIIGEITGMQNNRYSVRSLGVGEIQIDSSRIKQITLSNDTASTRLKENQMNELLSEKMELMKKNILNDKDAIKMIGELQEDPQFKEAMNDPEIINAVKSGDPTSLINNEKIIRLKDNEKIREINERLGKE